MENFFNNQVLFNEEIVNQLHIYAGSWLDTMMVIVTSMGHFYFCFFLVSVIFWCYDKRTAVKIGIVFILSNVLNDFLKYTFNNPRPDAAKLADDFQELTRGMNHNSPGFPSGHTQDTVSFWGSAIYFLRKKIIVISAACMILLVPYSRIYLGVHFPGDVLGGYLIGITFIACIISLIYLLEKHIAALKDIITITLLIVIPLVICNSIHGKYVYSTMGLLSGFLLGAFLGNERIDFYPKNTIIPHIIKIVTGITVLLLIFFGLTKVLPGTPAARFISSWLSGYTVTFIMPFLFSKIDILKGDNT